MRYKQFQFKNFKGIQDLTLPLNEGVTTLIGLNESGKTTILEAIFSFDYGAEDLEAVNPGMASLRSPEGWIPISRRANFSEKITITATVILDQNDQRDLRTRAAEQHDLRLSYVPSEVEISEQYIFQDSRYRRKAGRRIWDLNVVGLKGQQRNNRTYGASTDEWHDLVNFLMARLPRIFYFPDFLFELPERFEIAKFDTSGVASPFAAEPAKTSASDTDKSFDRSRFYRATFDNIIRRLGYGATLDTLLSRLQSRSRIDKRHLDALLLDMSQLVTETIFDGWNRILGHVPAAQEVQIGVATDGDGTAFLELKIKGPDGYYDLSERSLGFRWFFMFLLMTAFQRSPSSGAKPLILLDEPASNLHSSAQAELLKSFEKLIENCNLVYTTHSHHLINVRWLDSAYVVKNDALDSMDFEGYISARMGSRTSVTATKYRAFVSENPGQTSYIQPVLDVLNYRPSTLEPVPDVVLVEGKSDFFALGYMNEVVGIGSDLRIVPGGGAGSLDALIRLHIGWGKSFIILLDGDSEGKKQCERYKREFGPLIVDQIAMLPDLCRDGDVRELEDLFSKDDQTALVSTVSSDLDTARRISKKKLQHALIELYARRQSVAIDSVTIERFNEIFRELSRRLTALS